MKHFKMNQYNPTLMKQLLKLRIQLLVTLCIALSHIASADITVQLTSATHNGYNIRCFGGQDGTIHVEVTGGTPPYQIYMNGDLVSADITQLAAGNYSFIVYDTPPPNQPAELPGEGWITLTEPTPLQLNITPHVYGNNFNVSCYYCHDGYVTLNGQGGIAPYSYLWFDYSTNQTHYSLGTGSYSAIMTDANGCEAHVDNLFLSSPSRDDWTLSGNSGIDSTMFTGTTDNKDFVFKTNGTERMRIKSSGSLEVSSLAGAAGMVYVNSDGELENAVTLGPGPIDNVCTLGPQELTWRGYISPHPTLFTCPYFNVGIGTSDPAQLFTVAGNSRFISNSPPNSFEILGNGAIPANRGISLDGSPSGKFNFYINGIQTNASFNFINKQNSSNLMTINSNGQVGIGVIPDVNSSP